MADKAATAISSLYEQDETAWLEQTADFVAKGRWDAVDREHLSEYLTDIAKRDKREVLSRLVILITHWLKWDHQPGKRSKSWQRTIMAQ